jgi:ribonucleoside-diphosphate reductase alpha chain
MIRVSDTQLSIEEVPSRAPATGEGTPAQPAGAAHSDPLDAQGELELSEEIKVRPDVVEAKVYRLRSGFVKHNVYITLGWIEQGGRQRPIEIFFNSKDLTRSPEYAILTRLVSAIFRKSADPAFILEELRGIHDPNGGVYKNGRYLHSFYAEVAEVIERFFYEVGILQPKVGQFVAGTTAGSGEAPSAGGGAGEGPPRGTINELFKICPECQQRSLKLENGCDVCVSCGYSKCDK